MNERYKVYLECILLHTLWFLMLAYFVPSVMASLLAMILTAGYITHENNRHKLELIKRPIIWVSRQRQCR